MQEFTLKDLVRIFRKWWILVVAVPALVVMVSGYYNYRMLRDVYSARASLFVLIDYVDTVGNRRYDMITSREVSASLRELFFRSSILREAAELLEEPNLTNKVTFTFSTMHDTSLFDIVATGADPNLCAEAVNVASEALARYGNLMIKRECIFITRPATPSRTPIGPQRRQNVMVSAAVALLVTASGILIVEMFNQRVKTDDQVENALRLPVLGGIPNIRGKLKPYEKSREMPSQGIARYIGNLERESFKTMAANISFVAVNPTVKTIAITSVVSNKGMDAFMMLTAHSFAETGKSVLLVDMDFRNQNLGPYLRQVASFDLVDHLAGRVSLDAIIKKTGMFNVSFIGNNHSATLFTRVVESDGFVVFLAKVESMFDVVLFNTPPMDLYIDAAVLASKVGGTVLVLSVNRVDMKHAKAAVEQIKRGGAEVLGIALNEVKNEKSKAYQRKPGKAGRMG